MIGTIKPTALLSLMVITQNVFAGHYEVQDLEHAYSYLNQLREKAGMVPLSANHELETAAFNHANYLADNLMTGHYETAGDPGFTGIEPKDRTLYAGYHSVMVSENVSSGESNSIDAIDGLMSAIYHRMGFLDFVSNEVGIGMAQVSDPHFHSAYVFNMGNMEYNALCQGSAFAGLGHYYTGVCAPELNIATQTYDEVTITAQGNNPSMVVWPVEGDQNIPPAFFEESPDPLPHYSVSGYPISIQFNPLMFKEIELLEFELYREQDNLEVTPTQRLTQHTDPNKLFTEFEFALFPLERLDWNTVYRVEAKYRSDTGEQNLTWHFKTQDVGVPLFTIKGHHETLEVPPNTPFAVYVPPTATAPKIEQINYQFEQGMTVETNFKDGNTLLITLFGQDTQEATFNFSGGKTFSVKINTHASLPEFSSSPNNLLNLPSLGNPQALNAQGKNISTKTVFYGGISVEREPYQKQLVQTLSESVDIQGNVKVDPAYVGEVADLFVYAKTTIDSKQYYFMLTENLEFFFWDQNAKHLVAFSQDIRLSEVQQVPIYQGKFYYPGILEIFFGYRLNNGTIITSGEPIKVIINEE